MDFKLLSFALDDGIGEDVCIVRSGDHIKQRKAASETKHTSSSLLGNPRIHVVPLRYSMRLPAEINSVPVSWIRLDAKTARQDVPSTITGPGRVQVEGKGL